jgi:hypothetical protein
MKQSRHVVGLPFWVLWCTVLIPPVLRINDLITNLDDANPDSDTPDTLIADHLSEYCDLVRPAHPDIDRILRFAIANKKLSVVQQLLDTFGGNVLQRDLLGRSAIFYLAVWDDFDLAKLIIDRAYHDSGLDSLNESDIFSKTALWYAVRWAAEDAVTLLLSRGADPYDCKGIVDEGEDRRRILRMLRLSKLAEAEPAMRLTVSRRIRKKDLENCDLCSLGELQRNLDCWSEDVRRSIRRKTREHHLTWVHCPSMNVSLKPICLFA